MNIRKKNIRYNLFFIILITLFTSCDNDDDIQNNLKVTLDVTNNEVSSGEESFFLLIETNGAWSASVQDDWCMLNKTSGVGNSSVIGTVAPNNTEARSTVITVSSGGQTATVTLKQRAAGESPTFENAGRIEIPELKKGANNLAYSHYTTYNGKKTITYSIEYDCSKKHSRWIAFTFYDDVSKKNTDRTDAWADDPHIPAAYRSYRSDFSGYDRGHLCASADRLYSKAANEQTFYYSNMSPQIGMTFNQSIWQKIEEKVQTWGKETALRDTLYIVKGGTIDNGNIIKYNGNGVAVPEYYFMAILALKNQSYQSIGFWLKHQPYSSSYNISDYVCSIDELEEHTGINFFHNLPPNIEREVETKCEKNKWPGL